MSEWKISKKFDIAMGHRVHTQNLDPELSCGALCKCRHLHGHNITVEVFLTAPKLDNRGFVTDFVELNWFKKFLDDTIDHKFLIDDNDPMFGKIVPNAKNLPWKEYPAGYKAVDPNYFKTLRDPGMIEILESFVVVDFVPTSEKLSEWLFNIARDKMAAKGVTVSGVALYESTKSQSTYTA